MRKIMNDTNQILELLRKIEDRDLKKYAEGLVDELMKSFSNMVQNGFYEINSGQDMFKSVIDLIQRSNKKNKIFGLQTMLPENLVFLDTPGNNLFHSETAEATKRGVKIKRLLLVDEELLIDKKTYAKIIRNYYIPQYESKVEISIHAFNRNVLKEHPGHDFTIFELSSENICAEGGPIHKQADEVGYFGRIWKNDNRKKELKTHFNTLSKLPAIKVPREYLNKFPKIFIGSSSEGLDIANTIQNTLSYISKPIVWSQGVFGLSKGALEELISASKEFDFAILVLTTDDMTIKRRKKVVSARDNVLFELGLFMGQLGRERTFIVHSRDNPPDKPSDLAGVTTATYPEWEDEKSLSASLGPAITLITERIKELHFFE